MLKTVVDLEHKLSEPTPELVEDLKGLDGDILILGVSGKMGPTLAQMAVRAAELAGKGQKVYGAARFSNPDERARLDEMGVETIAIDLLNDDLSTLPEAPNVIYMVGHKFGTTGREHMAWAINTFTAGRGSRDSPRPPVCSLFDGQRLPLTPVFKAGRPRNISPIP